MKSQSFEAVAQGFKVASNNQMMWDKNPPAGNRVKIFPFEAVL